MSFSCRRLAAGAVIRPPPSRHVSKSPSIFSIYQLKRRRIIVLKSSVWLLDAVDSTERTNFRLSKKNEKARELFLHAVGELGESHFSGEEVENELVSSGKNQTAEVVGAAAVTVVLGVGNRVLYKLALVPLKHYPFLLAQFATFGYVLVYFSILYVRYRSGKVTDEMLSLPKAQFLAVGFLEALGAACGMAAGAILSGAAIPVLSQSFLVWQLLLSFVFLGRRYSSHQILGCSLVAVGVIITVASGTSVGSLTEGGIFWSVLMIASFLFQAADTVLKGRTLDLFVVNSYGSAFQAVFICLLLPFMSKLWGIPFNQLASYAKDGAACFLNIGTLSSGLRRTMNIFSSSANIQLKYGEL